MEKSRLAIVDTERCVGCQSCMFACARRFGDGGLGKTCIGVKSAGGLERGFVVIICRACDNPPCAKVCPTNALSLRESGGVNLDLKKCISCRNCVDACIMKAVFWDNENNKPMICVHCGYCVGFCPHNVLKMEKKSSEVIPVAPQ
ncbi:MAG: 4Fe-4S binding protein [Euryarchaeota archaeon]|nr:4Fe-4S binding protein [Euryarchaeota archaeon]